MKHLNKKLILLIYFITISHATYSGENPRITIEQYNNAHLYAQKILAHKEFLEKNGENYEDIVIKNADGSPLNSRERRKARKALYNRLHLAQRLLRAEAMYDTLTANKSSSDKLFLKIEFHTHVHTNLAEKLYKKYLKDRLVDNARLQELPK